MFVLRAGDGDGVGERGGMSGMNVRGRVREEWKEGRKESHESCSCEGLDVVAVKPKLPESVCWIYPR